MMWTANTIVTAADYNRMRTAISRLCPSDAPAPMPADDSTVPTMSDIAQLRDDYHTAATYLGMLSDISAEEIGDLADWPQDERYPDLTAIVSPDYFPAAAELNLYESLANYGVNRYGIGINQYGDGTLTGGGPFG